VPSPIRPGQKDSPSEAACWSCKVSGGDIQCVAAYATINNVYDVRLFLTQASHQGSSA